MSTEPRPLLPLTPTERRMLMHNRALATERDRYRALLERFVAAIPTAFGHQAECVCAQCEAAGQAVLDARTELGL